MAQPGTILKLPDNYRLVTLTKPKKRSPRTVYIQGLFLRGPIPLDWLTACHDMSGKTIMVALAIWWQAGIHGRQNIKLTTAGLKRFGVDRKAKDRALTALE